jgi:membrane protease YdiL (CAAX protease family)
VNPLNPSLLRAIRISAFCIFLIVFVPIVIIYASLLTHYDLEDLSSSRLQAAFIPFLLWFPYFWVFWRLRDSADAEKVKRALAHAVSWGWVGRGRPVCSDWDLLPGQVVGLRRHLPPVVTE